MNRFILSSLLFVSGVLISSLILNHFSSVGPPSDYMAAIIDKHTRATSISKPKLILAGGSNVAFGINSERIEQEFSVPVVNMALHGGLGLSFILEELKFTVHKGDIVLLSPEYFLSHDGKYKLKKNASSYFNAANQFYKTKPINLFEDFQFYLENTQRNFIQVIGGIFGRNEKSKQKIRSETSQIYSRTAFNLHGDVIAHLGKKNHIKLTDKHLFNYWYWDGINSINELGTFAKTQGVTVYYLFPNYPISEYSRNEKVIAQLHSDLERNLKIELLNKPIDFVYPDSLFFDTIYHLNGIGREKRTDKLIELLKAENLF